jgi:hypothetical protein
MIDSEDEYLNPDQNYVHKDSLPEIYKKNYQEIMGIKKT